MNTNPKILLTINIEGGTLIRKSEPEFINVIKDKRSQDNSTVSQIPYYPLAQLQKIKSIQITKYAYDYFVSDECPPSSNRKEWTKASKDFKLMHHLDRICKHFKGTSFNFVVLED